MHLPHPPLQSTIKQEPDIICSVMIQLRQILPLNVGRGYSRHMICLSYSLTNAPKLKNLLEELGSVLKVPYTSSRKPKPEDFEHLERMKRFIPVWPA